MTDFNADNRLTDKWECAFTYLYNYICKHQVVRAKKMIVIAATCTYPYSIRNFGETTALIVGIHF